MKLLMETIDDVEYITEGEGEQKNLYIKGIFMQAECKNKNNRIYSMPIMEREVNRYVTDAVQNKRAYGELGHPSGPTINLDRVSHMIESLKFDGKNVVGRAKITETPMGKIAKGLIDGGANLGVSSRGLGSLKPGGNGIMEVQEDFKLVTAADIVADPSAPEAFVQGIMEKTDWIFENGEWVAHTGEMIRETIKKTSSRNLEEQKLRLFERFLSTL